ncbi:hypothetical protein FQA39_LY11453 [Lamprigera yunnana]|nr:hypothetical protein FQA39_LY11453 [Lamprigera yunnana]
MLLFGVLIFSTVAAKSPKENTYPIRRFYIYPELIPHAAAALNLLIPHTAYNHDVQYQHPQYYYEHEDVEEYPEYEHDHGHASQPIQLLAYVQNKLQKKRVKKRKPNGVGLKKIRKFKKKCSPFRVRFTKKADFGHTKHVLRSNNTWTKKASWRIAAPGKAITEYPLQEPLPNVNRGSPPPRLLYNIYKDARIPATPNYAHLHQSTTDYPLWSSTEKFVTVTPTSAWVPLPKYYRVTQAALST